MRSVDGTYDELRVPGVEEGNDRIFAEGDVLNQPRPDVCRKESTTPRFGD
jgi:hypothetical protein